MRALLSGRGSFARFLFAYLRPRTGAAEQVELSYARDGEELEATLYRPPGARGPLPGWVVLHGLTCAGRRHPALERFVRALASCGFAVLVPDVPEWRRLRVDARLAVPTIRSAALAMAGRPEVDHERLGILGFSFGATQALVAAADPLLDGRLAGVASWGGYHDVERLTLFGLTGEHELDGVRYLVEPDPYGRWILGANYLHGVPGCESMHDVGEALGALALAAGHAGIPAGDPARAAELGAALARAAVLAEPLLNPGPHLPRLRVRTVVAHGRDDRLIPFSESVMLARALPDEVLDGCTITGLFAHSGGADRRLGAAGMIREGARFRRVLKKILGLI